MPDDISDASNKTVDVYRYSNMLVSRLIFK